LNRLYFYYAVEDALKFLSHLDLVRLFHRALRRSGLPMAYSQGFNPHPRLSLAAPLPVGVTAGREYGEVVFTEPVAADHFLAAVSKQLPAGLILSGAARANPDEPSLPAVINAARYNASWAGPLPAPGEAALQQALDQLLRRAEIFVYRGGKGGKTAPVNIRPYIFEVSLLREDCGRTQVTMFLQLGAKGGVSPFVVLQQLNQGLGCTQENLWHLHRQGLFVYNGIRAANPF